MSAYIVENKTINRIIAAILYSRELGGYFSGPLPPISNKWLKEFAQSDPVEIGCALYGMNENAVMQRYSDLKRDDLPGPIESGYRYNDEPLASATQIYKSLQCYMYQCSEGDVPELPLYKALEEYRSSIADHMITNTPEYERANWG